MAGQDMVGEVRAIKGAKAQQVAFEADPDHGRDGEPHRSVEQRIPRAMRPQTPRTVVSVDVASRKLNFRDRIDVRGMRTSEAVEAVQDLVDDALMVERGFGDHSARQGHRCAEGGDTPLPAHGVRNRFGRRRTCRPRRRRNYHRYF